MSSISDLIGDLVDAVLAATGADPIIEPGFDGVTIENCADCHQLTAVTTLMLGTNGDREARVCVDCMWNDCVD